MYCVELKGCSLRAFETASTMSESSLLVLESFIESLRPSSHFQTPYFTESSVQAFSPSVATCFVWIRF
jgi:hypothetical protein